jgi:16S rRNA (guanine(1405)-N(7))-methyltransferase
MRRDDADLAQLVSAVSGSQKYRSVASDLIRRLGAQELAKGRSLKEAIKATRNKLHQVAGAYQVGRVDSDAWLSNVGLCLASGGDLRPFCRELMGRHASTAERLSVLADFYTAILGGLPPIHRLLDLACGLNPLALPWMPITRDTAYEACDIYQDQVALLNAWFAAVGQRGRAFQCDLLSGPPHYPADVALLLKTIPCLEQVDSGAGSRLLAEINAPIVVVSYPVHSLGGRQRGMIDHYAGHFAALVAGQPWRIERFDFATELVYRIWR